ncbi:hypothetical protein [Streptomyces sp. DH10]|nr:hypothetical protein [Streptomyces sp. DH10]MDG9709687.1 hypothetical protein [Streptomyces sp. DH10]
MPILLTFVLALVLAVGVAMVLAANPKLPFFRQFFGDDGSAEHPRTTSTD